MAWLAHQCPSQAQWHWKCLQLGLWVWAQFFCGQTDWPIEYFSNFCHVLWLFKIFWFLNMNVNIELFSFVLHEKWTFMYSGKCSRFGFAKDTKLVFFVFFVIFNLRTFFPVLLDYLQPWVQNFNLFLNALMLYVACLMTTKSLWWKAFV